MEIEETALSPDARYRCGIDPGDGFAGRGWSRVWGSDFPNDARIIRHPWKVWKELFLMMIEGVSKGPFRTDDCCC